MQFLKNSLANVKAGVKKVAAKAQTLALAGAVGIASALGLSNPAKAAGPDMSPLTGAIDFGTVVTAVLAVAGALVVVYIAWKGAKIVLAAVRGG